MRAAKDQPQGQGMHSRAHCSCQSGGAAPAGVRGGLPVMVFRLLPFSIGLAPMRVSPPAPACLYIASTRTWRISLTCRQGDACQRRPASSCHCTAMAGMRSGTP